MSVLKGFLQPSPMNKTKDVIISDRFRGEDGEPLPFKIRVIDQKTNDSLIKQATKRIKVKGELISELDHRDYANKLVLACTIEPDFSDSELCAHCGEMNPENVPGKMLSSGEFNKLVDAINELNGFYDTENIVDEAKNS